MRFHAISETNNSVREGKSVFMCFYMITDRYLFVGTNKGCTPRSFYYTTNVNIKYQCSIIVTAF